MTTDADLRAYLDAHGTDGAPTRPGWYVVYGRSAGIRVWEVVAWGVPLGSEIYVPGHDIDDIARHAPLRLAAPDLGCGHPAACEGRAGAARWCNWCAAEDALKTARDDRFSALASLDDALAERAEAYIEATGERIAHRIARADLGALGFVVRYDDHPGPNRWSASMTGTGRGEGATRDEAIAALLRGLRAGTDAMCVRTAAERDRDAAIAEATRLAAVNDDMCRRMNAALDRVMSERDALRAQVGAMKVATLDAMAQHAQELAAGGTVNAGDLIDDVCEAVGIDRQAPYREGGR